MHITKKQGLNRLIYYSLYSSRHFFISLRSRPEKLPEISQEKRNVLIAILRYSSAIWRYGTMFNNKDVVKTVRKASLNFNLCMTQVTESWLEKRFEGIWLRGKKVMVAFFPLNEDLSRGNPCDILSVKMVSVPILQYYEHVFFKHLWKVWPKKLFC